MNRQPNTRPAFYCRGVGMLEILVAVLVISIGILGLATLQGTATRQNSNAYLRSQATILAHDIAERMRANRENADAYVLAMTDDPPTGTSRAAEDLNEWISSIEMLLPQGDGAIEQNGDHFTISVEFDVSRGEEPTTVVIVETEP